MRKTATGAEIDFKGTEKSKVKVRAQSTPAEIDNFHRLLEKCQELGMCEVINFSKILPNKGTSRYYRAYCDIVVKEEYGHG